MKRLPVHSARAMTLLEVVLAVLLLSLAAGTILGGIGAINTMEGNNKKQLAAYEIANRMMLAFLDDKDSMPSPALPIEYGRYMFFYDVSSTPAKMEIGERQRTRSNTGEPQLLERFALVNITVYEGVENSDPVIKGEPIASLSRIIAPEVARNPDTLDTYENNPEKVRDLINKMFGNNAPPNLPVPKAP